MRILYDHQILGCQAYGGISRIFFELINQFYKAGEPEFELSLVYSQNHYLNEASFRSDDFFFKNRVFWPRIRSKSTINMLKSKKALSKQQFDIFHPTYYDLYFLTHLKNKPFVLTIYDMIHEILGSQYSNRDKTAANKKILAQKTAKIIAISENTKKDILRFYPDIDEKNIVVTHLANSLPKPEVSHSNIQVPSKYILFVGGRGKYKNFGFFVKSIRTLFIEDMDLNVICVGGGPLKASEREFFTSLETERQIHHLDATDETLAWLYQNALAFVFPSLYEGFGIPVLEAFACGCPAILSNTSSLPEVGGEGAIYFDPRSEDSIKDAVTKVIYNEQLRDKLRIMGLKQLEKFSWEKTADKTKAIYRSIL